MVAVFAILCALAFIWAVVKYHIVYYALIDSFPPQFQDPLSSRYAFPEIVLSPTTPLALQADYVRSLAAACFAMFCFSLVWFSTQEAIGAWLSLVAAFALAISAVKSWRTYRRNCIRPTAQDDREET